MTPLCCAHSFNDSTPSTSPQATKPRNGVHRRGYGFTLVELLVVVGIIAVLIGILMPTLARARTQARTIRCASNLRQLGTFYHMYLTIFKGKSWFFCDGSGENKTWIPAIASAMGDKRTDSGVKFMAEFEMENFAHCPESEPSPQLDNYRTPDEGSNHGDHPGADYLGTAAYDWDFSRTSSYCFNGWLYRTKTDSSTEAVPWKRGTNSDLTQLYKFFPNASGVKEPNLVPMFGDGTWSETWPQANNPAPLNLYDGGYSTMLSGYGSKSYMCRYALARHQRKINMVFLDGHVEPRLLSSLWQLKWHEGYNLATVTPTPSGFANYRNW